MNLKTLLRDWRTYAYVLLLLYVAAIAQESNAPLIGLTLGLAGSLASAAGLWLVTWVAGAGSQSPRFSKFIGLLAVGAIFVKFPIFGLCAWVALQQGQQTTNWFLVGFFSVYSALIGWAASS